MTNRKKISVREQADAIAAAYLQKNPRKESYLVQIGPPEDDWREVSTLHKEHWRYQHETVSIVTPEKK